jgi:hypothetical protein
MVKVISIEHSAGKFHGMIEKADYYTAFESKNEQNRKEEYGDVSGLKDLKEQIGRGVKRVAEDGPLSHHMPGLVRL